MIFERCDQRLIHGTISQLEVCYIALIKSSDVWKWKISASLCPVGDASNDVPTQLLLITAALGAQLAQYLQQQRKEGV